MQQEEGLGAQIIFASAKGDLDLDAGAAMLAVLSGAPLLRAVPNEAERSLGVSQIYETLDANGDVLVSGKNYIYQGKKIKVLRESSGAGNILDRYQRIFYLNSSLEEDFLVVDASYPRGIFSGAVFKSTLTPADTDSKKEED